ncbi:PAS domain-containing protein [Paludisphaera sp.]|uniref:PAS domain-containing protein n=1 Tax=Paludisphaera sp. TaxID=2017432 RepID=UPI00301C3D49
MNLDLFDRQVQALLDLAATRSGGGPGDAGSPLVGEALGLLADARGVLRELPGLLELARMAGETCARRYAALFELAPVAYLATDLDGTISDCNREALNLLGGDPSTFIGRPIQARLEGDGREIEARLDRLRGGLPAAEIAIRLRDAAKGPLDIVARIEARVDHDGEPAELLWSLRAAEAARPHHDRREERAPAAPSLRPTLGVVVETTRAVAIALATGDGRDPEADERPTIRLRSLPSRAARRPDPEDFGDEAGDACRTLDALVQEMRTPLSVILISAHLLAEVGRGHPWLEAEAVRVTRQARFLAALIEDQRGRARASRHG